MRDSVRSIQLACFFAIFEVGCVHLNFINQESDVLKICQQF